jgi:uncharacterized protein (DUF1499 family)/drug/metabolite transporter superfamily protein YnfA
MIVAWLAFVDGLLAVALLVFGVVGAHWYLVRPFSGFQMFLLGFFLGFLALILGLIGIFATRNPLRAAGRPRAVFGTVLGLFAIAPVLWVIFTGPKVPAINDITTDVDNPPEFAHAQELDANRGRDMKYDKEKYAKKQTEGYPPLAPLKMPEPPDDAFKTVQRTAAQMPTWTITITDPATRTIEGYSTSDLFHFNDDFVIVVRQGESGGSLLEMRSKSRDGIGDNGVNHKRIKDFFAAISPGSAS